MAASRKSSCSGITRRTCNSSDSSSGPSVEFTAVSEELMSGSVPPTNRDIARVVGAASSDSSGPWVGGAALRPAIPCKLQKTGSRLPRTFVSSPVQQATDRLATVPVGASQLIYQITFGPRRLTPGIPVRQQRGGLVIREHETTHHATTHAECLDESSRGRLRDGTSFL